MAASAVLIPLALGAAWAGGLWFMALLAAGSILVNVEWTRMSARAAPASAPALPCLAIVTALATTTAWGPVAGGGALVAGTLVAALAAYHRVAADGLSAGLWAGSGVLYAGLAAISLATLRMSDTLGLAAILWVFALVWSSDTAAFAIGRLVGGPRLAPRISPAKTWSGAVAAVVAATLTGLIAAVLLKDTSPAGLAALGAGLGIVAILGDLGESRMKRRFGAKNAGDLIPGHGGLMDRVDSLVAVAVAAAAIGAAHGGLASSGEGVLVW